MCSFPEPGRRACGPALSRPTGAGHTGAVARPTPPQPPDHPPSRAPRRSEHLRGEDAAAVLAGCQAAGVEPGPWLAWAEATARQCGSAEAAGRAIRGAGTEWAWRAEGLPLRRPRRWRLPGGGRMAP